MRSGGGGVWGTPWTVAPVQVTGPWERGAGKAGPAVEPQRSGKQAVPLAVGAIRRQSKDPPRVSRFGAVEAALHGGCASTTTPGASGSLVVALSRKGLGARPVRERDTRVGRPGARKHGANWGFPGRQYQPRKGSLAPSHPGILHRLLHWQNQQEVKFTR